MSSQEEAEAEADDPPIIFGRGTRTAVFFVLDNHAVLRHETKTCIIILSVNPLLLVHVGPCFRSFQMVATYMHLSFAITNWLLRIRVAIV